MRLWFGLTVSLVIATSTVRAQVPQMINYQGRITVGGTNFTGTGQFQFALVNNGASLTYWSNGIGTVAVPVTKGLYSVLLGDTGMNSIPSSVFTNSDVRLRVWFDDGVSGSQQLTPDQRIAAVGYALIAANVTDGSITSSKLADSAVTSAKLAAGAVGSSQLASNLAKAIVPWQTVAGTTQVASANTAYLLTNATQSVVTLPANANMGDIVRVSGTGTGGWKVVQSLTNQFLYTGSKTNIVLNPGTYDITVYGAQGGNCTSGGGGGGLGAVMQSQFNFAGTTTLTILVGGQGSTGNGAGGGGGSFVVNCSTPLVIAGGGGGGGYGTGDGTNGWGKGGSGLTETNGGSGTGGYGGATGGGSGGNGADGGSGASGGAGYSGNGGNSSSGGTGGISFLNGGAGGSGSGGSGAGGFGGGAGGYNGSGGGAGGYSGGGAGGWGAGGKGGGGGGGSYSDASAITNGKQLAGVRTGNGEVDIIQTRVFTGGANSTASFQYLGNGVWQPLNEALVGAGTVGSGQLVAGAIGTAQLASNITVTGTFIGNGAGLTNVPNRALTWQVMSGTNQQALANTGYICTNTAQVTITLPVSPNAGEVVRVSGSGAGGWKIAQNAGQLVLAGNAALPGEPGGIWVARESSRSWLSVASSADGTKLVAVEYGGLIYTSSDSGVNWTARDDVQAWYSVASSADGTKLAAGVYNGLIYTSTNAGVAWMAQAGSGYRPWGDIASSADGTKLAVVDEGGLIYTSTDSGVTWTARESSRGWSSVACSADGGKLVAAVAGGQIFTSSDSGTDRKSVV